MKWFLTAITEADIDSILEIEEDSFRRPWGRISFLSELSNKDAGNFAIKYIELNGSDQMVAYLFFHLLDDEMHILKIAVAPSWRSRGIATWLMKKSLAVAVGKGVATAYLEVRPSNNSAIMLYDRIGFHVIAKRINYYSETGEDALVMKKNLWEDV